MVACGAKPNTSNTILSSGGSTIPGSSISSGGVPGQSSGLPNNLFDNNISGDAPGGQINTGQLTQNAQLCTGNSNFFLGNGSNMGNLTPAGGINCTLQPIDQS